MQNKKMVSRVMALTLSLALGISGIGGNFAQAAHVQAKEVSADSVNDDLKLWYTTPANIHTAETSGGDWMQQSLPLGNGNLGNLIFGGVARERIHFNEKTLWTGGPSSSRPNYQFGNKSTAYTAEEIESYRNILDDKSTNVFNDSMSGYGYVAIRFPGENNLYKGSYQDFGDIWLDFSAMGVTEQNVTDYRRELDLQTAVAATEFTYDGVVYTREHFVSSPDKVMVTNVTASETGKLDVTIQMELNNSGLTGTTSLNAEENTCTIDGYVKDNGLKFRTTMKIIPVGGTITANTSNQTYTVADADSIMIVMAAETDYKNDYPTYRDTAKNLTAEVDGRIEAAVQKGYAALKDAHVEDHQELFDRVSLDLGEKATEIPTNELMDAYRTGKYSKYLEVLSFQFGRYLTIAGSRGSLPSNLVGLWTVGDSAWTGDYHFNVNVQMNYWPVYVTNLAECGTTMVEYMENLREPGRLTAERVHGIEDAVANHTGFVVHTENNPFGMTAPTNSQEYGWNPTGAAWAIQNLWAHYEFTQDEVYLEEVIYPIMKEAALFWDQYLWTSSYQVIDDENSPYDGEARVVVAPSFSEEQGPTAIGTTYDQSLVWELYNECIQAGRIVGEDAALLTQWEETMQKLDPIEINATNGIKEWYEETRVGTETGHHKSYAKAGNLAEIAVPNSGWNIGHPGEQRHASHLVGLYPGTLINKENEVYMNAAIQSLTERGEYSTGWSKANKINLWARTGNGDQAYKLLNNLIGGKSSGLQYNLFDSHGSGGGETMLNGTPVWQIDGNYGLTAGVAEMLVQSQLGYVQFLPAIPDAWDEGEAQGLKARGNFTIGQKWYNGVADNFTVCYEGDEASSEFVGEYTNITKAEVSADGEKIAVTKDEENGRISFAAEKGVVYTIDMADANAELVKENAESFIAEIHPDLAKAKAELQKAVSENAQNLNEVLRKVKLMDKMYEEYLEDAELIYYMTSQEGLTVKEIDAMYVTLRQMKKTLLANDQTYDAYADINGAYQLISSTLQEQMSSRRIDFSIPSGAVSASNRSLTLTKRAAASAYQIRYTLDGSQPNSESAVYGNAITLNTEGNTIVRAALFLGEQRVSPIYTNVYTGKIRVSSVETETADWGDEYVPESMIDGDSGTRWASYEPSGDIEIFLSFDEAVTMNAMTFEQYVSNRNGTYGFEIWALENGAYKLACSGDKIGDVNDNIGTYYAVKTIEFAEVTTSSIKIVLKEGYLGEPSFYEIQPLFFERVTDTAGSSTALEELTAQAEAISKTTEKYLALDEELRAAFEESILDAKESAGKTQAEMDSVQAFLRNRYKRILEAFTEDYEGTIRYTAGSVEEREGVEGPIALAFDGNENTFWHSEWSPSWNTSQLEEYLWVKFEFEEAIMADAIRYLPRPNGGNGDITGYRIEGTTDGTTWVTLTTGTWTRTGQEWKIAEFEPTEVTGLRLVATSTYADSGNNKFASAAELRVRTYTAPAPEPTPTPEPTPSVTEVFTDVVEGKWYVDAVQYVYDNGLMSGNNGLFNPTGNVTRAQVVTTLYRLAGEPEVTDFSACEELSDVAEGKWYTNAICWAYSTGVTTGNTNTMTFNINTPVTRQQLASFFYRYADYMGYDINQTVDISNMVNANAVSSYALTSVKWAVATELISGSETTDASGNVIYDLKPQATASRAQLAAILQRFCNNI